MTPTPSRRSLAESFASALRSQAGDAVERVILYGSVSRGDDGPDSDVDLVVVCRVKKAVEGRIWKLAGKYLIETGVVFQPFVVSPEEYEAIQRRGSAFAHAVRDEGEVLA